MKSAVITLHAVRNYGSALQAYATQEIFNSLGFDVEIIDYRRKAVLYVPIWKMLLSKISLGEKLKALIIRPSLNKANKVFEPFLEQYLSLSSARYTENIDFVRFPINADIFCTGSDQVWNTDWHIEIPEPFFLSFVPDEKKKISFSASFGKEKLAEWEVNKERELLMRYDAISVRESSGVDILRKLGLQGVQVLDPTQLLTESQWNVIAEKERICKEKYILVYQLSNNKEFEKYTSKLKKKKGLKLIRLCTRYDQIRKPGKGIVLPTIEQFLALIRDAEYVLTDSFHATSFCLLFHKQFLSSAPDRFVTRLESILELFGLENRMINDYSDYYAIDKKIDYCHVDKVLNIKRREAMEFLITAIHS